MSNERLRIDANGNFGIGRLMGYSGLHKLNPVPNTKLVSEKLEEYDWFYRFLEQNLDVKERYERHKTFEILNNDRLSER